MSSEGGIKLKDLPKWERFRSMSDTDEQRALLLPYCEQYEDIEISEAMNAPEHGFKNYRAKLGILRKEPMNPKKYEKTGYYVVVSGAENEYVAPKERAGIELSEKEGTGVCEPMSIQKSEGMLFSLVGNYSAKDLQKKFLALAGMFEEGLFDSDSYHIDLLIHEKIAEENGNRETEMDEVLELNDSEREVGT